MSAGGGEFPWCSICGGGGGDSLWYCVRDGDSWWW